MHDSLIINFLFFYYIDFKNNELIYAALYYFKKFYFL